ncbi:MAG: hypothetical protein HOW73_46900 [Polyangiaceae bacterium]|nr:hypothetical protein [Polyangiaceae bacterium]
MAKTYSSVTDIETLFPVTADPMQVVTELTPWDGSARPGKCALSPDMVMLACYTGEDDTEAFDAIVAHAAARQ